MSSDTSQLFFAASPPTLAPWVEQVWYSRGRLEMGRERVLPSATADIVANLGAPMLLVRGRGTDRIYGTTVTGLLTRPLVLEHPEIHEAVGARLSPHGIRAVLGIPAAAVRDLVVDLDAIVDSAIDELREVCLAAAAGPPRLDAAIEWLRQRVSRFAGSGDPVARWATHRIDASLGRVPVAELQEASGYGATRFRQRFVDELGVSPKFYARLARFRAALDGLRPDVSLAELAFQLGYADQSHMNRDFRLFGDTSPTDVLSRRYVAGLTLAEPTPR